MKLSERDLVKAKTILMNHLDKAVSEMINSGNISPGFWGNETVSQMADASLIVLRVTADVNTYIEENETE